MDVLHSYVKEKQKRDLPVFVDTYSQRYECELVIEDKIMKMRNIA